MLPKFLKLKILPLTMVMAVLMLGMKINQIIEGKERLDSLIVSSAVAEEDPVKMSEAKEGVSVSSEDDTVPDEGEGASQKAEYSDKASGDKESQHYNQIELDILQSLAHRREEIEAWSEELDIRENVLEATELRIDNKISKMQELKKEVQALLVTYDKKQKQELQSLVKIYESMKPKDAARIFNELEMDILLDVVEMMSERKAAPVIAEMNSQRAKALTEELADRRRLQIMNETASVGEP